MVLQLEGITPDALEHEPQEAGHGVQAGEIKSPTGRSCWILGVF